MQLIIHCFLLAGCTQAVHDQTLVAIERVLQGQIGAWNKGDLVGFMDGYLQSEKLTFFSGKDRIRGWQKTLDRYRKRYQTEGKTMGHLAFSDLEVQALGPDSAWARGRWKVVRGNETLEGLFTLILKKGPDGWRIVHDHTSGS